MTEILSYSSKESKKDTKISHLSNSRVITKNNSLTMRETKKEGALSFCSKNIINPKTTTNNKVFKTISNSLSKKNQPIKKRKCNLIK